jgi:ribosome-associated protein
VTVEATAAAVARVAAPPDPRTVEAVREAVAAALDKKAEELKVMEVSTVTSFTDYFVVCSGQNTRQVQAIADGVEGKLRDRKQRARSIEGYNSANWILMDYGDFVLHVFLHERRRFYGLERLWSDAPDVTRAFAGHADGGADAAVGAAPPG